MSIEAILFDLDGLLVDSEPSWCRARKELAVDHGALWTMAQQKAQAGVHTDVWVANVRECIGNALSPREVQEEIVRRMEAYYLAGDVARLPGADQVVAWSATRFKTALASGSPQRLIQAAITGAGWGRSFRIELSSDEVGHGKPAPDVYIEALRQLEVDPMKAIVLEDSGAGIKAGLAAGCIVVAVPHPDTRPSPDILRSATHVLDSLEDFPALMQQRYL